MDWIIKIKKYSSEFITLSFTISSISYILFGQCFFYEVISFFVLNISTRDLLASVWRPKLLNESFSYFLVDFPCLVMTVLIYPSLLWQRILLMTCLHILILSVLLILKLLPLEWKQNCLLSSLQLHRNSNRATDNYPSHRIIHRREFSPSASTHPTIGVQVPGEINPVSTSPSDETRSSSDPCIETESLDNPEPGTSRDFEANVTSTQGPSETSTPGPSGDSATSETSTQETNQVTKDRAGNKNTPASGGDTVQISSELNMPTATVENEKIPASSQTLSPPVIRGATENSSTDDDWTLIEQRTRSGAVYSSLLWNEKLKVTKPVHRKK